MLSERIRSLREENAALRDAVPSRKNMLVAPGAPGNSSIPTARSGPVANLDLGNRLTRPHSGVSGDLTTTRTIEYERGLTFLPETTHSVPMTAGKVYWDHAQATGAPDTQPGDRRAPDGAGD